MARRIPLLDLLIQRYPEHSREELYSLVLCGDVSITPPGGGERHTCRNPREAVPFATEISLKPVTRYVSRGGEKLEAALRQWSIAPEGRVWLDAGASTGGFTQCLLHHGAREVHAVDVGYNQLDYHLRQDPRVHVHERTNVRDLPPLEPRPDCLVCDLSFRSVVGILQSLLTATTLGWGIVLVKPQFEATRKELAGTGGVVDGHRRQVVLQRTLELLQKSGHVSVLTTMESPVAGRHGNREELVLAGLRSPVVL